MSAHDIEDTVVTNRIIKGTSAAAVKWPVEPLEERLERCREFLVAHEVMVPSESRAVAVRIDNRVTALERERAAWGNEP